ncbi:MAG TPA: histidine--tRNA ligase [Polyangiales bacterium]|nr:histidine--tRNA ligase [Polyangiales bacterium]
MAKAHAQPARGTRDFLPLDVRRRSYVTGIIREVFERYGFEPLETPALERLDALLGKYGDEGDQLLFKVLLRGQPLVEGIRNAAEHIATAGNLSEGRSGVTAPRAEPLLSDLGLRYDLTVPLARVYAAHQGTLPAVFKRYQIQPVWRADTPGKGRFREFFQCDVDVVGSSSPLVEAEVTGAAAECMQRLGFAEFELRCNHRALLRALIEHAGIDPALEGSAITAIDKLDKIGRDGVGRELRERGVSAESEQKLLGLIGERAELAHIKHSLAGHEAGSRAIAELERVLALAQSTPAAAHLRFDATLARGLGYYTGCIFEIAVSDFAGSLGGGGRYDNLIGMFLGKQVPACGLALGLERLLVVMADRGMYPADLSQLDALVAAADPARLDDALRLAQRLRAAGVRVDLLPDATSPGKLRKQAEGRGVAAAAWLEAEQSERCQLWTKADGQTQRDLTPDALIDLIARTRPRAG